MIALLAARFLLELALVVVVGVIGYQLSDRAAVGWVIAIALAGATVVVWGILLSPRRRVDLPLVVRAVIELALFAAAAWGLAWTGHPVWGFALIVTEVAVLASLWSMGLPPGSDAGQGRARAD